MLDDSKYQRELADLEDISLVFKNQIQEKTAKTCIVVDMDFQQAKSTNARVLSENLTVCNSRVKLRKISMILLLILFAICFINFIGLYAYLVYHSIAFYLACRPYNKRIRNELTHYFNERGYRYRTYDEKTSKICWPTIREKLIMEWCKTDNENLSEQKTKLLKLFPCVKTVLTWFAIEAALILLTALAMGSI